MYKRALAAELLAMSKVYPIVMVTGPRQSGKTTLIRHVYPDKPYYNMESPDVRAFAQQDPRAFLAQHPEGMIIDEIQKAPELLSYLQVIVDNKQQNGMYILSGSQNVLLSNNISQSLAGRTAILNLLPLSYSEIMMANKTYSLDELLFQGFYPKIYQDNVPASKYYRDYVQTYIERDVREMIHVKDLNHFSRFIKLAASRVGQLLNASNMANELGVSNQTIRHWLSVLEASYVIKLLPPYYENFGKRIIKSPKLYFVDVGLACYLLDIKEPQHIARDPLRGQLFENFVIMDLVKSRLNKGESADFYFYRDSNQKEVDLIYKIGHQLIPVEIKASQTFHSRFYKGMKYLNNITGQESPGYVIYAGDMEVVNTQYQVFHYRHAERIFEVDSKDGGSI